MRRAAGGKPFHAVVCASLDIKGLLAANMAEQFFTPRNVKLTILLANDPPKSEGLCYATNQIEKLFFFTFCFCFAQE